MRKCVQICKHVNKKTCINIFFFSFSFICKGTISCHTYVEVMFFILPEFHFSLLCFIHRKKKWSHFDLKSWVTGGIKIWLGIPSSWRIFESNWLDIESQFDWNILQYSVTRLNFLGQNDSISSFSIADDANNDWRNVLSIQYCFRRCFLRITLHPQKI